jgi:hypothetical protein
MRPCDPLPSAPVPDPVFLRRLATGGTRLASGVSETRSFFANPS